MRAFMCFLQMVAELLLWLFLILFPRPRSGPSGPDFRGCGEWRPNCLREILPEDAAFLPMFHLLFGRFHLPLPPSIELANINESCNMAASVFNSCRLRHLSTSSGSFAMLFPFSSVVCWTSDAEIASIHRLYYSMQLS